MIESFGSTFRVETLRRITASQNPETPGYINGSDRIGEGLTKCRISQLDPRDSPLTVGRRVCVSSDREGLGDDFCSCRGYGFERCFVYESYEVGLLETKTSLLFC